MFTFPIGLFAGNAPLKTLRFDGTNHLSMSASDWDWNQPRDEVNIAGSIIVDDIPDNVNGYLFSRSAPTSEFYVRADYVSPTTYNIVAFFNASTQSVTISSNTTLNIGERYAFLVQYSRTAYNDSVNARLYINNTLDEESNSGSGFVTGNSSTVTCIGSRTEAGDDFVEGNIISLGVSFGERVEASDVFDGTTGNVKDLTQMPGAHAVVGGTDTPVEDRILATTYTNNNGVIVELIDP